VRIGGCDLDFREITGTRETPQKLVYEVQLGDLVVQPKGVTVTLANKVEIPYAVAGFENEDKTSPNDKNPPPGGSGPFRPQFDRRALPPEKQPAPVRRAARDRDRAGRADAVAEGVGGRRRRRAGHPRERDAPPGVVDGPRLAPAGERGRAGALPRALREGAGGAGSFDAALRAAFQSVLMSAPFRYMASSAHPDAAVAQHAIASRLSFMFWGAPPDAELRALAAAGKLRDPKVLDAQVDRLLADPRSDAFVRPFVMQWLKWSSPSPSRRRTFRSRTSGSLAT
jgi:hypothetical protein